MWQKSQHKTEMTLTFENTDEPGESFLHDFLTNSQTILLFMKSFLYLHYYKPIEG